VVMDCEMPGMDGYEAVRQWRQEEAALQRGRVPVIALTADALSGARERGLTAGFDDHITKPFRAGDLQAVLERWLKQGR
jgi:CheY-like chemotaxis protein